MALDPTDGFDAANGLSAVDDLPIFSVEPVQLQFSLAAEFVAGQVANNVIVLALSNGRILRIDLNRAEDIDGTARGLECRDEGLIRFQILTCRRRLPRWALSDACF